MKSQTRKLRPSLSLDQIQHIVLSLRAKPELGYSDISVLAVLEPLLIKKHLSINTKTESASANTNTSEQGIQISDNTTPDQFKSACYMQYLANSSSLSQTELNAALEYKYLHNLMSADESKKYEHEQAVKMQEALDSYAHTQTQETSEDK